MTSPGEAATTGLNEGRRNRERWTSVRYPLLLGHNFTPKNYLAFLQLPGTKRLHVGLPYFAGVGIGVVHAGYERRLARHLGAHSTPSIIGIINGKISFFHNAVVPENLRQFIESLLPGNLVEKVSTWLRSSWRGAWA